MSSQAGKTTKRCPMCSETKPLDAFAPRPDNPTPGARRTYCRPCTRVYNWNYRRRDPERTRAGDRRRGRKYRHKRDHGLTIAEYDAKVALGCSICGTHEGKICLDHDHDNGRVRAALCHACNRALGMFADDPERLRVAALYVEDWEQRHAGAGAR